MTAAPINVRWLGEGGHQTGKPQSPLLTQSGLVRLCDKLPAQIVAPSANSN
jgi:hypothetical protein